MTLSLPEPIATYIAAENADNAAALSACFAADAVVRDEGRTIRGLEAITAWKAESKRKYQHTVEPLDVTEADGRTVLTARVTGQFPGSPVELRFAFGLAGDRIASLEIVG
ncbi:limonene-1,2-epoxide hydrolase [Inquilinus ginsengisoli]|uniref:Limonene-1,2-epoxide hydrolase n=1 Tax=Inquilinus ginsengisoli TaxID=363840 RepID=A0ABU1JXE0_9PROT|nr:nuclear transport factor 2 family protein [Inquilinus ginsengisoli]MDR6292215.1 limonene-1,2-epoxide hydrolase [Inquilinus ginsengisoli]